MERVRDKVGGDDNKERKKRVRQEEKQGCRSKHLRLVLAAWSAGCGLSFPFKFEMALRKLGAAPLWNGWEERSEGRTRGRCGIRGFR